MRCNIYLNKNDEVKILFNEYHRVYDFNLRLFTFLTEHFDNNKMIEDYIINNEQYTYDKTDDFLMSLDLDTDDKKESLAVLSDNNMLSIKSPNFYKYCNGDKERKQREYVPMKEYAKIVGKNYATIQRTIRVGSFPESKCIGAAKCVIIPKDLPYPIDTRTMKKKAYILNKPPFHMDNKNCKFKIITDKDDNLKMVNLEDNVCKDISIDYISNVLMNFVFGSFGEKDVEPFDESMEKETVAFLIGNTENPKYLTITSPKFFKWLNKEVEDQYMPYITTEEFARKNNKTAQAVRLLVKYGKSEELGAIKLGRYLYIPTDAVWPEDRRKYNGKKTKETIPEISIKDGKVIE